MRFADALVAPGLSAVAEIKRRSPSAGDLRPDADPAVLAAAFERAGAAAVSVLVDDRFGGSLDDLRAARAATALPLLGKGFFTDESDLLKLREAGADAALLLLRDLDDERARRLIAAAHRLGLDALVEAHTADELERALALDAGLVGINARDLATFRVDRGAQLELLARVPDGRVLVAESGIECRAHAAAAELAGADAILVGATLMRAPDPAARLRELLARPLVKVCGLTRDEDVAAAVDAGADLVGFILARETPRRAPRVLDVPKTVLSVAVFVEETEDTLADLIQLYRRENGHRSKDAVLLRNGSGDEPSRSEPAARIVDLPWQGEDPQHFARAARVDGRLMLAGRLSPENVRDMIRTVRPWAVDASSSLEIASGIKDHDRIRAFVDAVRSESS
jgi:indole-3-glycerol phosphate synthase/phosphoribosylanthranilate isomerase